MIEIFQQALLYPTEFFLCVLFAFIPVLIWMYIFLGKGREDKFHIALTFFFGIGSAGLVLLYQSFWGDGPFNLIFFNVEALNFKQNITTLVSGYILTIFCIYMGVGFLEEFLKHWVVVQADKRIFSSIDDVIELSIVAALGFSFLENVAYFYREFLQTGMTANFYILAIQRSLFVMFIHIICSAIYGYYYGLGFFARPYMQRKIEEGKTFYIARFFHWLFNAKKADTFRYRMAITGLLSASILHGLYDFMMEWNPSFSIGSVEIQSHSILLPSILVFGVMYLSYLLNQKIHMEEFGKREQAFIYSRFNELQPEEIPQRHSRWQNIDIHNTDPQELSLYHERGKDHLWKRTH